MSRRTRRRAAWPLGGRARAEMGRARNLSHQCPHSPSEVSFYRGRREQAVGKLQAGVLSSPVFGSVRSPRVPTWEGANLQCDPGGRCARSTGYALTDGAVRTGLRRRDARVALFC